MSTFRKKQIFKHTYKALIRTSICISQAIHSNYFILLMLFYLIQDQAMTYDFNLEFEHPASSYDSSTLWHKISVEL